MFDIQHPLITEIERYGHPAWMTEETIYCEKCQKDLSDSADVYDDWFHEYLCEDCLLELHRKEW